MMFASQMAPFFSVSFMTSATPSTTSMHKSRHKWFIKHERSSHVQLKAVFFTVS